jgi:hypothetical protein
MTGPGREIGKERDFVTDQDRHEHNSWADVASREWQTFGVGAAEGAWKNGLKHYEENPLAAVRDVGTGVALQMALKGPGVLRVPAMAIAAIGGIDFAANSARAITEAMPRMSETASNAGSAKENRQWAENNLGPVAFDIGVMGASGALFAGGSSAIRRFRASAVEPVAPHTVRDIAQEISSVRTVPEAQPSNVIEFKQPQRPKVEHQSAEARRMDELLSKHSDYTLLSKMERGTRGAWLVESPNGRQSIFKLVSPDDVTPQIRRSAESASAANSLASRTPRYERVEYTPGYGSWYVQSLLPGKPAPFPSDALIGQMAKMNDRQAGKATTTNNDWSQQVVDAVFHDSKGWQKRIANSGPEGKQLVEDVRAFVEPYRNFQPRTNDVVHGDFQHWNALVGKDDRMTGYVDWEGAGNGDRAIDLSRLLYDAYVSEAEIGYKANPNTLNMLSRKIENISGRDALDTYMSHWILQVADYGVKKGPQDASMFIGVGNRILNDLKAMHQSVELRQAV